MREVRSFDTTAEANLAAGLLRAREIPCEVRGEAIALAGGMGAGFPFSPSVWIQRDEDLAVALKILGERQDVRAPAWICPACRSRNETSFDACWSCGTERP